MTISAKVIADSTSEFDSRITTLQLRYPRFIHAEFMTHRVFSRNASSSRAIPVSRLIDDIIADTAMPLHWGKNQAGMQADEECNEPIKFVKELDPDWLQPSDYENLTREEAWCRARDEAIKIAKKFNEAGYHKQIVNRLLEPFSHINVIVTATEWYNFFELRDHKDAQPEIQVLARAMKEAMEASKPQFLQLGEWHLPYVDKFRSDIPLDDAIKISVARCARVSYLTHEGKEPTLEEDLNLYNRLLVAEPLHASPAEHQATPNSSQFATSMNGNFNLNWVQYRKILERKEWKL